MDNRVLGAEWVQRARGLAAVQTKAHHREQREGETALRYLQVSRLRLVRWPLCECRPPPAHPAKRCIALPLCFLHRNVASALKRCLASSRGLSRRCSALSAPLALAPLLSHASTRSLLQSRLGDESRALAQAVPSGDWERRTASRGPCFSVQRRVSSRAERTTPRRETCGCGLGQQWGTALRL